MSYTAYSSPLACSPPLPPGTSLDTKASTPTAGRRVPPVLPRPPRPSHGQAPPARGRHPRLPRAVEDALILRHRHQGRGRAALDARSCGGRSVPAVVRRRADQGSDPAHSRRPRGALAAGDRFDGLHAQAAQLDELRRQGRLSDRDYEDQKRRLAKRGRSKALWSGWWWKAPLLVAVLWMIWPRQGWLASRPAKPGRLGSWCGGPSRMPTTVGKCTGGCSPSTRSAS